MKYDVFMCRTIKILIANWPRTQKFSQLLQAGKTVAFVHRRKMSTHALQKMTRDRFRVISLAPRRKCPRNVVQMKEAMAVTALQFIATVRDQKLFWSKFWWKFVLCLFWLGLIQCCWRWDRWFACGRHAEKVSKFYSLCLLHDPCN